MIGSLGFVASACLALVFLLAFGGTGAYLQLDRATRGASAGSHRRRPGSAAHPHRVRAGDAVLVAVRSEGIDVDPAGGSDGEARVVLVRADAGAESGARHDPDSLQQPGPVSGAAPLGRRGDGAAADGFRHRIFGTSRGSRRAPSSSRSTAAMRFPSSGRCCRMLLLTFGEVLVSATGLEFAYSQAPLSMKGVIMAFWYLSVTIGNLWVLLVNATVRNEAVLSRIAGTGLTENRVPHVLLRGICARRRTRFGVVRASLPDAGSLSSLVERAAACGTIARCECRYPSSLVSPAACTPRCRMPPRPHGSCGYSTASSPNSAMASVK